LQPVNDITTMNKLLLALSLFLFAFPLMAIDPQDDTISIKPIGVDYSKYAGTNKLFMVGECEGMEGNQIVVFQSQPSFEYFEKNEDYAGRQKKLEEAIWREILDNDAEEIVIRGRWHMMNERRIFLANEVIRINQNSAQAG
jgi:hypothetical protein